MLFLFSRNEGKNMAIVRAIFMRMYNTIDKRVNANAIVEPVIELCNCSLRAGGLVAQEQT